MTRKEINIDFFTLARAVEFCQRHFDVNNIDYLLEELEDNPEGKIKITLTDISVDVEID